jgi:hypothetical protein
MEKNVLLYVLMYDRTFYITQLEWKLAGYLSLYSGNATIIARCGVRFQWELMLSPMTIGMPKLLRGILLSVTIYPKLNRVSIYYPVSRDCYV